MLKQSKNPSEHSSCTRTVGRCALGSHSTGAIPRRWLHLAVSLGQSQCLDPGGGNCSWISQLRCTSGYLLVSQKINIWARLRCTYVHYKGPDWFCCIFISLHIYSALWNVSLSNRTKYWLLNVKQSQVTLKFKNLCTLCSLVLMFFTL